MEQYGRLKIFNDLRRCNRGSRRFGVAQYYRDLLLKALPCDSFFGEHLDSNHWIQRGPNQGENDSLRSDQYQSSSTFVSTLSRIAARPRVSLQIVPVRERLSVFYEYANDLKTHVLGLDAAAGRNVNISAPVCARVLILP